MSGCNNRLAQRFPERLAIACGGKVTDVIFQLLTKL